MNSSVNEMDESCKGDLVVGKFILWDFICTVFPNYNSLIQLQITN